MEGKGRRRLRKFYAGVGHGFAGRRAASRAGAAICWAGLVLFWRRGKVLTRRRCNVKGDPFWGERGSCYSNDARRLHLFQALRASEPLHAC